MIQSPDLLAQLGDYQAWKGKATEFDLLDYVQCVATPDLFFGFLALLRPELVRHKGDYFLASHFVPETYERWMEELSDPVEVQKVMNHLHISALIQGQEVSDLLARGIALRLAECWSEVFSSHELVGEAYGDTFENAHVTLFRRGSAVGSL